MRIKLKKKKIKTKNCEYCDKIIHYQSHRGMTRFLATRFCSMNCFILDSKKRADERIYSPELDFPERIIQCEVCGKDIKKYKNRSWNTYKLIRFCSQKCLSKKGRGGMVEVECDNCGVSMKKYKSHVTGKTKYCSRACKNEHKTEAVKCEWCGKEIRCPKSLERKFCSKECHWLSMRKNGVNNQGRRSPEDLAWKKLVFERDKYECQLCGVIIRLEAHHIKSIKDFPNLRHVVENGITYCHDCHYYKIHRGMPNYIHGKYVGDYKKRQENFGTNNEEKEFQNKEKRDLTSS